MTCRGVCVHARGGHVIATFIFTLKYLQTWQCMLPALQMCPMVPASLQKLFYLVVLPKVFETTLEENRKKKWIFLYKQAI